MFNINTIKDEEALQIMRNLNEKEKKISYEKYKNYINSSTEKRREYNRNIWLEHLNKHHNIK